MRVGCREDRKLPRLAIRSGFGVTSGSPNPPSLLTCLGRVCKIDIVERGTTCQSNDLHSRLQKGLSSSLLYTCTQQALPSRGQTHSLGQTLESIGDGSDLALFRPRFKEGFGSGFQNALQLMYRAGPQVLHLIASTTTKTTITRGTITSVAIGAVSHVLGSIPFMRV